MVEARDNVEEKKKVLEKIGFESIGTAAGHGLGLRARLLAQKAGNTDCQALVGRPPTSPFPLSAFLALVVVMGECIGKEHKFHGPRRGGAQARGLPMHS